MKYLILLAFVLSCGDSDHRSSVKYSYELKEKNCSTGYHAFTKDIDYCNALLDPKINNNCAFDQRIRKANQFNCQAVFNANE